ncbi:hypothetical protein KC968_00060 [Candidatus Saccharibacteria bacterium]|nr:hypothetical protein [Candidatus Saccharibacteria bacterium]
MMTRVKGFVQEVATEQISSGQLYVPSLQNIRQAEVYDGEISEVHRDALRAGVPVVALALAETLNPAHAFEVYPTKTIDSQRSAHGVSFGRFVARAPHARKGLRTLVDVAVKPFDDAPTALNEMHGYHVLDELGVETFQPVGIFPAQHGDHFIAMSRTRRDMQSLDRDTWVVGRRVNSAATAETAERNTQTIIEIAETMAYIHANGVFHPDGQIKNWSVTADGTVGVIDTENLTQVEIGSVDAPELAWYDISKLVKSLILENQDEEDKMFGVGMLAGMAIGQVRENIQELIVAPYVDALVGMISDDNLQQYQHIENLVESVTNRFHVLEPNWPEHLVSLQQVAFEYQ